MKNRFCLLSLIFVCSIYSKAQTPSLLWQAVVKVNAQRFSAYDIFEKTTSTYNDTVMADAMLLTADQQQFNLLMSEKKSALKILLPTSAGVPLQLDLLRFMDDENELPMMGTLGDGVSETVRAGGLHYRGCIASDPTSLVAISVFEDGTIMGLFSGKDGNWVLGNYKQQYVMYQTSKLLLPKSAGCSADENKYSQFADNDMHANVQRLLQAPPQLCRKVRFYWEADFNLFRYSFNGNLNATRNYLIGVFNMTAALFQNEGILVELAEANIWTSLDPYRNNSSNNALDDFKQLWNNLGNSFNGDIAHLVCGGPVNNGGLAYLNVMCNKSFGYAYSNVFGQYNAFPAFSFDVEILAHETGHNMGSNHTHWCGWNTGAGGTCGAIDNCGTPEAVSGCSTCPATNLVSSAGWQGTVMSYCYVVNNIGVNFSNGFGPLPQAVIRNTINTSNCLTTQNRWTGTTDTAWAKTTNWGCATIPNNTTDVVIGAGVPNMPVVTVNAVCRSLRLQPGATVAVRPPAGLQIAGGRPAVITQPPSVQSLFITGTSTPNGWMANGDLPVTSQQFYRFTNTLYLINSLRLSGGGALAFVPLYGVPGSRYGYAGTALTNATSGDAFIAGGNDLRGPLADGFYRIAVDFQRGRYNIFAAQPLVPLPTSAELFITGSATPGGWMNNGDAPLASQKFIRVNNTLYELPNIALTAGGSFLLVPVYGNWGDKYGGMGPFNNSNSTASDFFQQDGSDLLTAPVSGNYKVVVDFQTGRYQLVLQ